MTQLFPERLPQAGSSSGASARDDEGTHERMCDARITVPTASGVRAVGRKVPVIDERPVAEAAAPSSPCELSGVEPELRQIVRLAVAALVGLCLAMGAVVVASAQQARPAHPSAPLRAASPKLEIPPVQ